MLKRTDNFHEVLKKINAELGQVESKLGGPYIKLYVKDELEHRKLTKYLKIADLEYFTMTPRSERPIKVVIRGIPPETPAEYVKESLIEEYKFEIEKVAQLTQFKTKRPLPIYQITLKNNEVNKGIWNVNTLMLVKVTVRKFERKTGTIQCFNCNQWHHSAAGCGYKPRCIKCGGPHAKDQCTEKPKDVPICINYIIPIILNKRKVTTNWQTFKNYLNSNVKYALPNISNPSEIEIHIKNLTTDILNAYHNSSRPLKPNEELHLPPHIRDLKTVRNRSKKVWQRSRDPVSKNSYNIAQARFRSAITDFNQTSYSNEIEQLNIYDGSLWQRTKRLKTKRSNIPQLKNPNSNLPAHTNLEKAEILANHFETQFTSNDIRDPNTENTVINSIAKFNSNSSPNKFKNVKPSEITDYLKKIKINKTPGMDGITNKMLKNLPLKIILKLTNIYNYLFKFNYFPNCWKTARILPILKPGKDPTHAVSYRPISLLPTLSKLGEKFILNRYMKHANQIKIPIPQQFGFTAQLSTTHQLLRVIEHIHEGKANRLATAAIFLDIAKAFDKVWIQGLIHKLIAYHFPPYIIKIICSYLQDRYFTVAVKDTDSSSRKLNAGVPQGGILAPYIFVLFMNDVPQQRNITLSLYADDTAILAQGKTPEQTLTFPSKITL
ncbi:RNA-directed DNA polymerase from mobile element jockey [Araneus ventricosus]|uniref:RNA-directed DNA polymerase from mobile element jockey n=1 Tax=Araneus ventricosus TaxID=182803 RepID=A0A4Y2K7Q2_ARAVE|nr:RNA-directed DNA polymerase from mobile element jockey [Araneus ventricosus]